MSIETVRTKPDPLLEEPSGQRWRSSFAGSAHPAMRRQVAQTQIGNELARKAAPPPNRYALVANRLAFGPSPQLWSDFQASGSTGDARLQSWINEQLWPPQVEDSAFENRLANAGFVTLNKSHQQLWQDHVVGSAYRYRPAQEVELATLMRAAYSRKQLFELLVDFWHNHFNAHGWDYWSAPVWVSYDRTIRNHLLGNFRSFLGAIAKHSAMLYYLDQYTSSKAGPNENYARELLELHTLGAENYFGLRHQDEVPVDENGKPLGYVDDDVFEAMYALTGWTLDFDTGEFQFRAEWHDLGQKRVLGIYLPANGGLNDGETVLDVLASHPGTARHIARKLCRRLIADEPPESLVEKAAGTFLAQKASGVQLLEVYRTILLSSEFKNSWGLKIKRPLELVVGAIRATGLELNFGWKSVGEYADDVSSLLWRMDETGQPLFGWRAPDGYPDRRDKWESTTPRVMTWRLVSWLTDIHFPNSDVPRMNLKVQTPNGLTRAGELVDFWAERVLRRPLASEDRQELVDLLGFGSETTLVDLNDEDDDERLRATVGVLLNSPYFLER